MTPDDLLTLIYTSGEAGPLKGVQLTRGDVTARVASLRERLRLRDGWRAISWLPMAHIAERLCAHYLPLAHGWQITTCADPCGVTALLADIRPELLFAPPTRWKDLRASVLARFDGDAELAAMDTDAVLAGLGLEQLRAAILGPASCRPEVVAFWHALGVPLGEVCGLSESTSAGGEHAAPTLKPTHRPAAARSGAEIEEL